MTGYIKKHKSIIFTLLVLVMGLSFAGDRQADSNEKNHLTDQSASASKGRYNIRFHFIDDDNQPYSNKDYVIFLPEGKETTGTTDENGYTESYYFDYPEEVRAHLILDKGVK